MSDNSGIIQAITSLGEKLVERNSTEMESLRKEVNKGFREFRESCNTCNIHLHNRISKASENNTNEIKEITGKQNKFIGIVMGISFLLTLLSPYIFPKYFSNLGF
jgi:hypothetical protein